MLNNFLYTMMPWSILFLRIALGAIFIVHGMPKLKNSATMAAGMGMTASMVWAVGLAETVGGISVLVGLLAHIGALAIAVVMGGALHYKINKWNVPFSAMDKMGWEFDLILLAAALAIATVGAGTLSLDWMVFGMY